ncbi:pTP [Southern Psittacara leucophthalmus aviadenovirus]|uniref:PTP n=1 Tax=Southern Psittacara leucophthalmus aviadenovirus TaxID=2604330 RepID=A0AAE6IRP4_9ADEN|nr:pTP [Southern Psittacara leucophthalmus aviadenovirus]QEJ80768.2 pTP [Southern Psittacara leucophthalmus aviadenovirus]
MAAYRVFADLTGQSLNTIRFCEPVIAADYPLVREEPALVDPRQVFTVSRLYDYRLMQLRDLSPGSPNVNVVPYNHLPPPHFLLGYQYMHRAVNDYMFDNRIFMQIGYERPPRMRPSRLYWHCLIDCSYAVNVGQYMRFLDLDNFHGTFEQMHNAVLMDRVAADMGIVHLRGRGIDIGRRGNVIQAQDPNFLGGGGAGGLQTNTVMRLSSGQDAELLANIRLLNVALCHYIFCIQYDRLNTENMQRFLPGSDVFGEPNWLEMFVDTFAPLDTQQLIQSARLNLPIAMEDPAEAMARLLVSVIAGESPVDLVGGAIRLRNREVGDRPGLRPRNRYGRAVTATDVRRGRRRAIQQFVDRLPRRQRRRHVPPPEPEEPEEMEVEEREESFLDEVVRVALGAIDALQQELSGPARRHELFRFGTDFYRLLLRARDSNMVSESFLRKWVLYFFLAEHVASTLYYMYTHFIANREFRRYVDVNMLQVLVTGWDVNAQPVFKRIWSEQSNPATIFETLWDRVLRDFLLMVEKTGQFEGMDELDQQLFLSDIQYRDKSGDIEDVMKQLNLSEELIDSIDISFRVRFKGIVAICTREEIKANLRRFLRDRQEGREGR